MTVKELIELLQKEDQTKTVYLVVDNYTDKCGGVSDLENRIYIIDEISDKP